MLDVMGASPHEVLLIVGSGMSGMLGALFIVAWNNYRNNQCKRELVKLREENKEIRIRMTVIEERATMRESLYQEEVQLLRNELERLRVVVDAYEVDERIRRGREE